MVKNMSNADGVVRILIALTIVALWYFGVIAGPWLVVLTIVAAIFIVTGFVNFCPLYAAFGWRTRKKG